MNKYVTEMIGTFFLVFAIGLTGNPLIIGSALMIMVYMGGHISGAHYNPAVSIGVFLRGKLDSSELGPYIIAQTVGGLLAALMVKIITDDTFAPAVSDNASMVGAILIEILFTFALVLVVLNVATAKATEGNSYYGLAIGFTVVVAAAAGGGISGGAYNPAVGIGPILIDTFMGDGSLGDLWLYIVMPVVGAVGAAYVFKMQNPDDA